MKTHNKQASRRRVKSSFLTFDWSDGFWSLSVIGQSSPDVGAARGAFTLALSVDFKMLTFVVLLTVLFIRIIPLDYASVQPMFSTL